MNRNKSNRSTSRDGKANSKSDRKGSSYVRKSNYEPEEQGPKNMCTKRIDQVQTILNVMLKFEYAADVCLSYWFRLHKTLGQRDRAQVAGAVFDCLRNLRLYRQLAQSGSGPQERRLALLALSKVFADEPLFAESINEEEKEWLLRIQQIDLSSITPAVRYSVPDWLYELMAPMGNAENLFQALNESASLDIRVNPLKAERDEMLTRLKDGPYARFNPKAMPYSMYGIRFEGHPALSKFAAFEHGHIEVQDEGSQLLALLVSPRRGEMVIDFCAGAGGKTLLLGALMRSTGRLYAFDVSTKRLANFKPRLQRSGLSNVYPVAIEHENDTRVKRLAGKASRVLVDAPCSGIGTLRRNPDLKWRQTPQDLTELCALQQRILASASRCVQKGGRLVYATCSLLPQENEEQITKFLADHPEFELLTAREALGDRAENLELDGPYLKLRPDLHGTDGFFAAVMQRKAD